MWAHDEAERLYPSSKLDEATLKDAGAGRKLEAERHVLYEARKKLGFRLAAKKYGLAEDVLTRIDEEGAQKKWKVSETPILFDRHEAEQAVLISRTGTDPTEVEEVKLRAFEERQHTIEIRNERRAARRKNQPL